MKEKKETTAGVNLGVVNSEENSTVVNNIEVVGAEVVKTESRVIGVKVITDEDVEAEEALVLEPFSFITESGEEYKITVPKFRFKGQEYDSQKTIDEAPEVLETLIEVNAFFIKKA